MRFEWDEGKAARNLRIHGISFEEAVHVFDDPNAFWREDYGAHTEPRWHIIGTTLATTILLVVFTVRNEDTQEESYRVISAREAGRRDRRDYYASLSEW